MSNGNTTTLDGKPDFVCVCVIRFLRGSVADTTGSRRTLLLVSATVGHSLKSTPTNGRRFTALSLPWRSPIQVLTETDVT
jgi:hypothetical protein